MPRVYKIPGYAGNALLLVLSVFILGSGHVLLGVLFAALALLNIFLIHKLDRFSREEVWLAHEIQMAKLREQLLIERKRVSELERTQTDRTASGQSRPRGPEDFEDPRRGE